jgi:hypothetical protein
MKISFFCLFGLILLVFGCTTLPTEPEEWDISSLNTGQDSVLLTDFHKKLVLEMNKMRTDPLKYAKYHKRDLPNHIYKQLLAMDPLPPLIVEDGLVWSASEIYALGIFEPNVTAYAVEPVVALIQSNEFGDTSGSYFYEIIHLIPDASFWYYFRYMPIQEDDGKSRFLSSKYNYVGISEGYNSGLGRRQALIVGVKNYKRK